VKSIKSQLFITMATAAGLLLASAPARAHHGVANLYDMSKAIELKGTITMFEWTNPHNQIHFDVTDEKTGKLTNWVAATEPPQVMLERGWSRRIFKAGDKVTVFIFAAKNGAPVGNLQKIVMADGKEYTAAGGGARGGEGGRGAGAAPGAPPAPGR
jgi:hypothetical protein